VIDAARIVLVALAIGMTWLRLWPPAGGVDAVALVTVVGGYPIYREAVAAVIERRMTMELSMTIAIGAAAALGELLTALVIVLFVLVAEVLEYLTIARGRGAIKQLLAFLPNRPRCAGPAP
jgi:P-type Cu+ transporter